MIIENLCKNNNVDNLECKYSYRLIKGDYNGMQAYGIEIERIDYDSNVLVNIERNQVKLISPQRHKVQNLLNLLYENNVSPIHLVDIIGEYVDEYIGDFDQSVHNTMIN